MSGGVSRIYESVCLSVCPQHKSKMNDPKVFKLSTGIPVLSWDTLEVILFWGSKVTKVKVTGSISAFFTLMSGP